MVIPIQPMFSSCRPKVSVSILQSTRYSYVMRLFDLTGNGELGFAALYRLSRAQARRHSLPHHRSWRTVMCADTPSSHRQCSPPLMSNGCRKLLRTSYSGLELSSSADGNGRTVQWAPCGLEKTLQVFLRMARQAALLRPPRWKDCCA